jgi:hypothetical protein
MERNFVMRTFSRLLLATAIALSSSAALANPPASDEWQWTAADGEEWQWTAAEGEEWQWTVVDGDEWQWTAADTADSWEWGMASK